MIIRRSVNAEVSYVVCLYAPRGYSLSRTRDVSGVVMMVQYLTLNISKTKRWFIMTSGVLQICDLENDGPNCSVVIKVASFHCKWTLPVRLSNS